MAPNCDMCKKLLLTKSKSNDKMYMKKVDSCVIYTDCCVETVMRYNRKRKGFVHEYPICYHIYFYFDYSVCFAAQDHDATI